MKGPYIRPPSNLFPTPRHPTLTPRCSAGPQVNNHTLLEFTQSDADVTSLRVTEAMLWVFLRRPPGARHHDAPRSNTRLWVFRVPPGDVRKVSVGVGVWVCVCVFLKYIKSKV